MKINLNKKSAGIVLIVALFAIVAAGIIIAGYLALMKSETGIVSRSQLWNQCVGVMEAGVEEAMGQIQYCGYTTNFSTNSWTYTNGYYQKTRTIGTNGSYCVVSITPANPPVIYSEAYVPIPGTSTNYVSREVKVATLKSTGGKGGLIAKGTITMSGGSSSVDSYDSSLGNYAYDTNTYGRGTNALVMTDSTTNGAINMSGGQVYGQAVTGGGTISLSGGATIGPPGTASGTKATGYTANDANVNIPDNTLPDTSSWTQSVLSGGVPGNTTNNYQYFLNNDKYVLSGNMSLSGGGSSKSMVVAGNCSLYITGSLTIAGGSFIYMMPGASLNLYMGGALNASGGSIVNMSGLPANLHVYGLPTCTSVIYSGGSDFFGIVNAPEAAFTFSGGAGAYGSYTAASITISGGSSVHYDTSIGRPQFYMAGSWNEITAN